MTKVSLSEKSERMVSNLAQNNYARPSLRHFVFHIRELGPENLGIWPKAAHSKAEAARN